MAFLYQKQYLTVIIHKKCKPKLATNIAILDTQYEIRMHSYNSLLCKELVDELSQREGIEKIIAEPYQDMEVKINGPTIVLIVRD